MTNAAFAGIIASRATDLRTFDGPAYRRSRRVLLNEATKQAGAERIVRRVHSGPYCRRKLATPGVASLTQARLACLA
jgi:hypothetical protein